MPGRWYHRNINGIEAEKLLEEFGQDGSFLIRPSQSTINSYTLSVRCGDTFKHIKIQNNGDCGYEIGEGGDKFATLAELVEHFIMKETLRDKLDGNVLILKYPLNYQEPTSERYFHGAISGADAASLLMTNGKSGSYLVRESRSDPQNYVLCVRCENNKIVHLIINYTSQGYTMQNLNKHFQSLDEFINECIRMCPIVDVKDNVVYLKQPLCSSRVNAINFNARIQELEREANFKAKNGFSEEFEHLQQVDGKFLLDRKDGTKPENRAKNRFKTILPFDQNRVKLINCTNNSSDPNTSDYINANRIIPEEKFGKTYLATQGPLPNTLNDFWSMIWQEKSQIILMITHEEEKGRVKCARYWPEPTEATNQNISQVYDDIKVTFVKLTNLSTDYILRQFTLTKQNDSTSETKSMSVYQFQYLAWSDHGVPDNVQNTINFVEHVNKLYKEIGSDNPITVHCSAGIGRTGAVIVIDMIIDKIKTHGIQCDIDLYKTVSYLRSQRSGMIQTEKQYQYLYKTINYFIEILNQQHNYSHQRNNNRNNNSRPLAPERSVQYGHGLQSV